MPLYKRKPFALVENPDDLKPQELIFQIRLTKEIFRNYEDYLKRIKLYRQKVWTCKATGKSNLTYEDALSSEKKAAERFQSIPLEYVAPVYCNVQYSMLNLKDLVNSIATRFQGPFSEGDEFFGRKDGKLHPCKTIKVVEEANNVQYEVSWLGSEKETNEKTIINSDELSAKNLPFSKRTLKAFIKDSTYRSLPWVLHDNLAKKHGISNAPPIELKSEITIRDGLVVFNRKRKKSQDSQTYEPNENGLKVYRRKNWKGEMPNSLISCKYANGANLHLDSSSIKYPIDDLLVKPDIEDRHLTERPSPNRVFNAPMNCIGDLLMVWDFCTSYGRLFNLSPFSLEDFENSICYKESTPLLIVESYSALLHLLMKDNGKFSMAIESKKLKPKITLITWTEYLCEFLETSTGDFSNHISAVKRGHYALLDVDVKLGIFQELVAQALETYIIREKLDEFVEERLALAATRRDEALDEGRKKREEKELRKAKGRKTEVGIKSGKTNLILSSNGNAAEEKNEKVYTRRKSSEVLCRHNLSTRNSSEIEGGDDASESGKKLKVETNLCLDNGNHLSKREIHKLMKNEIKESIEMRSSEQRKEYLEREIEKRFIRASPLGKDRNYNRYWFFRRDGRIFVESSDFAQWGYYQTKEELDSFIGSLNTKGERERALKKHMQKSYYKMCLKLQTRSKEAMQRGSQEEESLIRRSTRVRAPPGDNPALAFLKYVNKWKEN